MKTITQARALELLEVGATWLGKATYGGKTYLHLRLNVEDEDDSLFRVEIQE